MSIKYDGCFDALPILDKLELKVKYLRKGKRKVPKDIFKARWQDAFCKFLEIVRSGYQLFDVGRELGRKYYLRELDVTFYQYGLIRINQPNEYKLNKLQGWIDEYFDYLHYPDKPPRKHKNRDDISEYVKLYKVEFTYDFYFDGGTLEDYASLTLRLAASLFPRYAVNTFAVAIVGKPKKCRDGAKNGNVTVYIQSCDKASRRKSSDKLNRNLKAATKTIIYSKELQKIWCCRVEMIPNPIKLNKIIEFDPENIADVLEQAKLPFSRFYEFKEAQPEKLIKYIKPKDASFSQRIIAHAVKASLVQVAKMPVCEQVRAMSNAASRYGVHPQTKARLINKISMEDAVNRPLPDGFHISQRKGKHELPADTLLELKQDVKLKCLHDVEKVKNASQVQDEVWQLELPISNTSHIICGNLLELGFSEHKNRFLIPN